MTFTSRIRAYLIAVAVTPPLLVMVVIYFHSVRQIESSDRQQAYRNLRKFDSYQQIFISETAANIEKLLASAAFNKKLRQLQPGHPGRLEVDPRLFDLSFVEIVNDSMRAVATFHRPGLLGEKVHPGLNLGLLDSLGPCETVEYDIDGPHASITFLRGLEDRVGLLSGRYLDRQYLRQAGEVLGADLRIVFEADTPTVYSQMQFQTLYEADGLNRAVVVGGPASGFYLVATFAGDIEKPVFLSLLLITGAVALISICAAIGLGIYITGRAKREIENLVEASTRIASGDFSTPVMAYEEGEFSHLADSFTDMMVKLKALQKKLTMTEKIAAWQAIGRKVAHEIKNPLTPIAVSADDLRRSYHEQLPDFGTTLDEATATIKGEVGRMTRLLEQFVNFGRMKAPVKQAVRLASFLAGLEGLYRREIGDGRLVIVNRSARHEINVDPEALTQVLINLIKNGLETGPQTRVTLLMYEDDDNMTLTIEDTGPGFTEEALQNRFEPYVSSKPDGSGLGLVICYRIVHDHGGTIELHNRPEGGAGVTIRLPI